MKIGIIGSVCSGKTTLANQLAKYFKFDLVRNYEQNDLKFEHIQYEILFDQIKCEIFSNRNIICDRTIIDNFVHLEKLFKPKMYLLKLVRSWAETYDVILLCKKLPFIDDGFRKEIDMEHAFISFMKNNLINFEIVEGNKEERFEKSKKIIERMLNK